MSAPPLAKSLVLKIAGIRSLVQRRLLTQVRNDELIDRDVKCIRPAFRTLEGGTYILSSPNRERGDFEAQPASSAEVSPISNTGWVCRR